MISFENVEYRYSKKHELIIKQESLNWPKGNITGLLGSNGAGKTTLLKLLAGWLFPTNGNINISGFEPKNRQEDFLKNVYFVPYEHEPLYVKAGVYCQKLSPFYPNFNSEVFLSCCKSFDIDLMVQLDKFSTGSLKKFNLSFAIASGCGLLLLDEPSNSLDIQSKDVFRNLLVKHLNSEQTCIISSHQIRDTEQLFDTCWLLNNKKIQTYSMDEYELVGLESFYKQQMEQEVIS